MKSIILKVFKVSYFVTFFLSMLITFNFSYAQNYNRVYAPDTRNLNFLDTVALHTYCSLSKLFTKENSREKCFVDQNKSALANIGFSSEDNTQNTKNQEIINLENRLNNYENELDIIKGMFLATSSRLNTKIINNTIVKYLNTASGRISNTDTLIKNNSVATGMFNTILSEHAYVYGEGNIVQANASSTLTLGKNLNNNIANSVQIGINDNTKLTILGTTTENKNNGWVGLAGVTSPLNLNTCVNATNSNCFEKELLRVPGKIVARAFEVSGAADFAENFPADEDDLEAGYIVEFGEYTHKWNTGGDAKVSGEYELSGVIKARSSKKAIGIIATNPGFILGGGNIGQVPVAFSGRVPVKVTDENGVIKKGDKIKVSDIKNGFGAKLLLDGNSVGTALSDSKNGVVLVLVKSEYIYNLKDIN